MKDSSRGTLDVGDQVSTAASMRELDAASGARGHVVWTLVTRRRADGAIAGYTDLYRSAETPHVAEQGDTAVAPQHRVHVPGEWLKALMLERLHRERADVEQRTKA